MLRYVIYYIMSCHVIYYVMLYIILYILYIIWFDMIRWYDILTFKIRRFWPPTKLSNSAVTHNQQNLTERCGNFRSEKTAKCVTGYESVGLSRRATNSGVILPLFKAAAGIWGVSQTAGQVLNHEQEWTGSNSSWPTGGLVRHFLGRSDYDHKFAQSKQPPSDKDPFPCTNITR